MNWFTRGLRNIFRNITRAIALFIILGLAIGLSLTMLIANQAIGQKISNVNSSVDNQINISPAGLQGFNGGGNPLTESQIAPIFKLANVSSIAEGISDRLNSSQTNLKSATNLGSLGKRFASLSSGAFSSNFNFADFSPPITVIGTNDPTNLTEVSSTSGGGTFSLTAGQVFSSNSSADEALIGKDLASKNNLSVGSTFTVYSTTIKVAGIFSTGTKFGDAEAIFPLATLQNLTGQQNDLTSVTVYVNKITDLTATTNQIKSILGANADVTNSAIQAQDTVNTLQGIQSISVYGLIGTVLISSIIIVMAMIMIIRERFREVGILKAIGAKNSLIIKQFIVESAGIVLISAVIGLFVGVITANPITKLLVSSNSSSSSATTNNAGFGGGFPGAGSGQRAFRAFGSFGGHTGGLLTRKAGLSGELNNIHAVVGYSILLYGLLIAVAISIVISIFVTIIIARIKPAQVLRSE